MREKYIPISHDRSRLLGPIFFGDARSVTVFSPDFKERVRATLKKYKGRQSSIDIVLTIGRPNFDEREYLTRCRRRGVQPNRRLIKKIPPRR